MNFRTSYLAGLIASALVVFAFPSAPLFAADPLKITGPDGESRQTIRQYGPTSSADTFWSIAQKVRPDNSITVYQVMAAIYEANPHAFTSDNYNSLERGMILLIPTKAEMAAIPKSLAKQQAEYNDKGWRQGGSRLAKHTVKPAVQPAPAPAEISSPKVSVETQKQIEELTTKLEAQQATNLSLTDELARAQDKLNLGANDIDVFQAKIDELNARIAELDEALLVQKEQKAALSKEVIQLREQIEQLKKSASSEGMPTAFWRNLMDNPLYLALAVSIPGLLLFAILWAFFRRRNEVEEEVTPVSMPAEEPAPQGASHSLEDDQALASDDDELMAVHLDTDDEKETLESVIGNDAYTSESFMSDDETQYSQEFNRFDEQDEGQSLDDLWAEAMGEHDELANQNSSQEEQSNDLDLDDLLRPEYETELEAQESEADSAFELDEKSAGDVDLDALMADLDNNQDGADAEPELEHEAEPELEPEIASEHYAAQTEEASLDSLLQAAPDTVEDEQVQADQYESAEYEPESDALFEEQTIIADGEASPSPQVYQFEDDTDELIKAQLDAELELLSDPADDEADLDALLASFGLKDESASQVQQADEASADPEITPDTDALEDIQEEQEAQEDDQDQEQAQETEAPLDPIALSTVSENAPLEFESFTIDDANHDIDPVSVNLEPEPEDNALDSLLADLQAAEKKEKAKDSGFFDDLKGDKSPSDNSLDWDDGLNVFSLDDDHLDADDALAALKAEDQKQASIVDHDLSSFQQDNGYIDIDKLLNDADDEAGDADQYKELDIDMGELNDLMSNADMVDVDDEENSVNAKLDLARAYIEIEDNDSASALLKEVELDGNERQQEEAKQLLKGL